MEEPDRRRWPRSLTAENLAAVQWWQGHLVRQTHARLVNVGPGGALLEADHRPPVNQAVWLRLREPQASGWVEARVVRWDGPGRVGVAFTDLSPPDLIAAANPDGSDRSR
jgi:hypothetical protein